MKQKLSITIEKNLIKKIDETVNSGLFRNKSHLIEYVLNNFLRSKP
jgi:Arc/MetJ-type ribon-helix-helix transcriptional regulator